MKTLTVVAKSVDTDETFQMPIARVTSTHPFADGASTGWHSVDTVKADGKRLESTQSMALPKPVRAGRFAFCVSRAASGLPLMN